LDEVGDTHRPPTPPGDPAADVLLRTYVRSTKSYRGALLLAGHGFGPQAGMLARSLFEDMVVAHYVVLHPKVVDRLEPARRLMLDRHREALSGFGREKDLDEYPEPLPEAERRSLQKQFPGGRWTGLELRDLVSAVEHMWVEPVERRLLKQIEKLATPVNNALIHHSPLGLEVGTRRSEGRLQFMLGADMAHVAEALGVAFFSYANLLTITTGDAGREASNRVFNRYVQLWVTGLPEPSETSESDS
jgi:Family of unknown function (DUF5677)